MEYSIVIRTVGKAQEKYQRLLDSIQKLNIQPIEILVVLPKGYEKPKERLGYETFVYSEKGMVQQRIEGGKLAKGEYILFLDDDVEFDSDFIEQISEPILKNKADVSVPPQFSMLPPKKGIRKMIPMLTLSACPTILHKDMYVKILNSGGWAYHRFNSNVEKYLQTESAAGICCFTKKSTFLAINFEDELWLQDVRYPLWEDQVMFYKFCKRGFRVVCVTGVYFLHLDAGAISENRNIEAAYANSRNKYIFWHRFLYEPETSIVKRMQKLIAFKYSIFSNKMLMLLGSIKNHNKREELKKYNLGYKDGKKKVKSVEYRKLDKV